MSTAYNVSSMISLLFSLDFKFVSILGKKKLKTRLFEMCLLHLTQHALSGLIHFLASVSQQLPWIVTDHYRLFISLTVSAATVITSLKSQCGLLIKTNYGEIFSIIYVGLHGKCLLLLSNFNQNQNV